MTPFHAHRTASDAAINNIHRLKKYREFMGVGTLAHLNSLDIGAPNYISQELRVRDNTRGDFNRWVIATNPPYDVITCFEVLNHTMNPLNFMEGIHYLLAPRGRVFLATPRLGWLAWFHGPGNFSEYKPDRLETLFRYAGFDVVRKEIGNPWPLRFIFYGIRPPFRYLLNRYVIWELAKSNH